MAILKIKNPIIITRLKYYWTTKYIYLVTDLLLLWKRIKRSYFSFIQRFDACLMQCIYFTENEKSRYFSRRWTIPQKKSKNKMVFGCMVVLFLTQNIYWSFVMSQCLFVIWYVTIFLIFSLNSNTAKLGYNELGYNKHSVITNYFFSPKWSFHYMNRFRL